MDSDKTSCKRGNAVLELMMAMMGNDADHVDQDSGEVLEMAERTGHLSVHNVVFQCILMYSKSIETLNEGLDRLVVVFEWNWIVRCVVAQTHGCELIAQN